MQFIGFYYNKTIFHQCNAFCCYIWKVTKQPTYWYSIFQRGDCPFNIHTVSSINWMLNRTYRLHTKISSYLAGNIPCSCVWSNPSLERELLEINIAQCEINARFVKVREANLYNYHWTLNNWICMTSYDPHKFPFVNWKFRWPSYSMNEIMW